MEKIKPRLTSTNVLTWIALAGFSSHTLLNLNTLEASEYTCMARSWSLNLLTPAVEGLMHPLISSSSLKKKHVYHWDTTMFKVVPGLSTAQCPPYINYYSKSDRSLDKLVPRKTNTTKLLLQVLSETGILYQIELLKSSQWKLWKKPPGAMFKKTLTPLLIFIQHAHHVSFF